MATTSIEQLRARHAEISAQYTRCLRKAQDIEQQVKDAKAEIARLESRYEGECLAHASGDAKANPAALRADIDSRKHRLVGLDALLKEAAAGYAPFWEQLQSISEQIIRHEEDAEQDRLNAAHQNLEKSVIDLHKRVTAERIAAQQASRAAESFWKKTYNRRAAQAR